MPNDPHAIGNTVREYLASRGIDGRVTQAGVVADWASLVGKQLAEVSRPEFVDASDTLWVRVKSAAWIQELQLQSPMIIRDLAKKGRRFRRIRWLAGDLSTPAPRSRRGARATPLKEEP
jgi:predicted nucleic acid-binding Zn ribbon protein